VKQPKPPDVVAFARILHEEGVNWVLVGGMAMTLHGSSYVTVDLDLAVAKDESNVEAWSRALKRLGARFKRGGALESWDAKLFSAPFLEFESELGPFHVLNRLPGIASFSDLQMRAQTIAVGDVRIPVASLEDLITMKSHSQRPKDKAHLLELQALQQLEGEHR
jgi:predicted nucleotidyltransferase